MVRQTPLKYPSIDGLTGDDTGMRKDLVILSFLLVLLLSFFAYNAYTYHELSTAGGAYKLAGIPGSGKIDDDNIGPYTGVGYFMEVVWG
ncbi:hypothetical protein [Thermococcus sp. Bubb.Bath]|uniref:hypothetical protein n=1 Tax=Thermococcus sp. Bubb.Bath TaxID=1638242 RepID=UPI00143CBD2B|nr:hypothetical protein [Thermococcus sp. Bubb.Bath]NJF25506.1 hypothetical protein [Thermococcus sp. Bubb.Bath]